MANLRPLLNLLRIETGKAAQGVLKAPKIDAKALRNLMPVKNVVSNQNHVQYLYDKAHRNVTHFLNSKSYQARMNLAKLSEKEQAELVKAQTQLANQIKFKPVDSIANTGNAKEVRGAVVSGSSEPRNVLQVIGKPNQFFLSPSIVRLNLGARKSPMNTLKILWHEILHSSSDHSQGLGSTLMKVKNPSTNQMQTFSKGTGIIDKALEYDKAIQNKYLDDIYKSEKAFTDAALKRGYPLDAIKRSWNGIKYMTEPTEWRSRGLDLVLTAANKGKRLKDYIASKPINDPAYRDMRSIASDDQIYNYASRALGLSVPIGLGISYASSDSGEDDSPSNRA